MRLLRQAQITQIERSDSTCAVNGKDEITTPALRRIRNDNSQKGRNNA